MAGGGRTKVTGQTSWRIALEGAGGAGGEAVEANTRTAITLDDGLCRWEVGAPGGGRVEPVESDSPHVRRFLGGVVAAMRRQAADRRIVHPVPKPRPAKPAPVAPHAPVPCPVCGTDPWIDCPLCDGEGAVTARRAAEWRDAHGGD